MIELNGKFANAKVFTDVVDNESISQVINLLNQPYVEGSKVRMMPDIHFITLRLVMKSDCANLGWIIYHFGRNP